MKSERYPNLRIAALAGIVAGTVATVAEILLWLLASVPVHDTLVRDARLTAAIVMGPRILASPSTSIWPVMIVASVVHFGLSIAYAAVLATAINRLSLRPAVAAGAVFGLLLYGINMYGFTPLFPWFAATRDSITAGAHVVFGATAAAVYSIVGRHSFETT